MRILQISSARHFGGGEKHLIDLIAGLRARGHDVFLAAPEDSPLREKLHNFPEDNFLPVDIHHALHIAAALKLSAAVRRNKIDIVHAHVARDYVAASLAVRFNPPVKLVLTRHVLFPMKPLHRLALSNVAKVIAVSSAVEKVLLKDGIFPARKIAMIPNGIDISHWAQADHHALQRDFRHQHGIAENTLLIGTVGELKKLKGQEDFILAAEIVRQKYPDAQFIVVGKDNSGGTYREHLKKMVSAIDAGGNFIWLDWIDDTAPLLHALNVFVSASHSESFGLSILEAMASGCAVVATTTEGAMELLGKDLVPIEHPVKLAAAIVDLLGKDEARKTNGKYLQNRATEMFDLQKMINATEKIYRDLNR
jgi:glycosyltransferase involved in cell wall biosynthesis